MVFFASPTKVTPDSAKTNEPRMRRELYDELSSQTGCWSRSRRGIEPPGTGSVQPSSTSSSRSPATNASTGSACCSVRSGHRNQSVDHELLSQYGAEVQQALAIACNAANAIRGKRLVPFLPELIPHTGATRSPRSHGGGAQAGAHAEPADGGSAARTSTPVTRLDDEDGRLLTKQIPVRTFTRWTDSSQAFWRRTWSRTAAAAWKAPSCTRSR